MARASAPQLAQTKGNATDSACCIVGTPNDASAWVIGPCNPARSVVTTSEHIRLAAKQTCTMCQEMDTHVSRSKSLCVQGASCCERPSTMHCPRKGACVVLGGVGCWGGAGISA